MVHLLGAVLVAAGGALLGFQAAAALRRRVRARCFRRLRNHRCCNRRRFHSRRPFWKNASTPRISVNDMMRKTVSIKVS